MVPPGAGWAHRQTPLRVTDSASDGRELWLPVPSYVRPWASHSPYQALDSSSVKMDIRLVVPISQGGYAEFSRKQSCENILLEGWPTSTHKTVVSGQRS